MSFQVKNNSKMQFARYSEKMDFPVENKYISDKEWIVFQ